MDFTIKERQTFQLVPGDVLVAEASGSVAHVGRAAIWRGEIAGCCFQNTLIRFRPHAATPEFAAYQFRHIARSGTYVRLARGVGILHIGAKRFSSLPFRVPPLPEQVRIVNELDDRLKHLAAAAAALQGALANIHAQGKAILAAAATGELDGTIERGVPLGTSPEVPAAQHDSRPGRPWSVVRVDEAGSIMLGKSKTPDSAYGATMRPYLRVANVQEDRIDTSTITEMAFSPEELEAYELRDGDILLNDGQSADLVGRPAMYRGEVPGACFQNHLIRFRASPEVDPAFALLVFRHYLHSGEFRRLARWSTNIATLSLRRLGAMPFPLPSRHQQAAIVEEASRRLAASSEQELAVRASLARLREMEAELLRTAMAGELVAQNSADEPAETLLARIGPPPVDVLPESLVYAGNPTQEITLSRNPRAAAANDGPIGLTQVLRDAQRPLSLPELFSRAGYERDLPEHVELFYLALRDELGKSIQQLTPADENVLLMVTDAT